jgi:8-oxo-dGTP diphosphatase
MNVKSGTVCFILSGGKVLLTLIEYPDGRRLWNGIGGIIEDGESVEDAASREIAEETRIVVESKDVRIAKTVKVNGMDLYICIANRWSGEEIAVDPTLKEMCWFSIDSIPYNQMHKDNDKWLPDVFETYA